MLIERMIRAARLEVGLYEEVEADQSATQQALMVVIIVAIASAIGGALSAVLNYNQAAAAAVGQPSLGGAIIGGIVGGILTALIFWVVWAYVTYFVGTNFFGGTATPGEMLRTIGFAQSPGVLRILIFIPAVGPLIGFLVGIWTLVAGVIAVRQALDFTTGKAILTVIIGAIVVVVCLAILGVILAAIGLGIAMV
jgi:hypothetical protein